MYRSAVPISIAVTLTLVGCASMGMEAYPEPARVDVAEAILRDANGAPRGEALLTQLDEGIRLILRLKDIESGIKAAHIHTTGRCDGAGFTNAGGHWNPTGREHGRHNPAGQHMGDMTIIAPIRQATQVRALLAV